MKICLITSEFYPHYGGVSKIFTTMCKKFKDRKEKLYIFTNNYFGKNIYNLLFKSKKKYNYMDFLIFCKQKNFLYYFIKSIWKIISDTKLKFYFRFNMVLYLLIKPHILVQIIHNLLLLDPYLRKIQPDLLLISSCGAVIMPLGYILSRMREKKYLCWAHGDDFIVHTHYSLKSFYLKPINKIIVTCNRMKDLIIKINHLNDDKIIVIPIGLDLSESIVKENKKDIRKELNIHDDEFILISVGRHAIRKNFQIVIKAVNKIKKSHPQLNLKYILVGQGKETQNLKDLTKKLNLEKEVLFFGAVNDVRKNKYLKAADVFVTPSITLKNTIEGFGIVFLEANYHKVPVIGTFAGGIPEAIENYKSGILVKPNDLSGLINAIVYLYKNVDERRKMGEYGHKKVIKNHNWEILINEYIKLFKEIIE